MASINNKTDQPVEPPDSHFLNAAQGWLALGNAAEAALELSSISKEAKRHPDVLETKWDINAKLQQWNAALESACDLVAAAPHRHAGWIQRSFALHELKRTPEAYELLLPAARRFRTAHIIPYNLACYCCQMNRTEEARKWIRKAIELAGLTAIQQMAKSDPDLNPMQEEIQHWKAD